MILPVRTGNAATLVLDTSPTQSGKPPAESEGPSGQTPEEQTGASPPGKCEWGGACGVAPSVSLTSLYALSLCSGPVIGNHFTWKVQCEVFKMQNEEKEHYFFKKQRKAECTVCSEQPRSW